MLQLNSITDYDDALTRHERELQSLRQIFSTYSEHVARLNNNSIAVHQENQRLRTEVEALRRQLTALEATRSTVTEIQTIGGRIFTACTSVLNWFSRKIREIAGNFRQNPHSE